MAELNPYDLKNLVTIARMEEWQYKLDEMTDERLSRLYRAVEEATKELDRELLQGIPKTGGVSAARKERFAAEMYRASTGIKQYIGEELSANTVDAAIGSFEQANDIVSWGGRVPGFNTVAMAPAQVAAFVEGSPLGGTFEGAGRTLQNWVEDIFLWGVEESVENELLTGALKGEDYRQLVKRLQQEYVELTQEEITTLARTYVQSANVGAMESVYRENPKTVNSVRWSATLEPGYKKTGRGTCIRCAALDGNRYPVDKHPRCPLHPRCVLPTEPALFIPNKVAAFVSPYSGPVIEIGLSDGRRITTTINHVFLTDQGFAPSHLLRKGDNIIDSLIGKRIISGTPNNDRKKTRIDNVVEAFSKSPGTSSMSVPVSSEYLYGDGGFANGYIDIIASDSLLRGDYKSFFLESLYKKQFITPDIAEFPLSTLRLSTQILKRLFLIADSIVRYLGVSPVFLRRSSTHHEAIRRSIISDGSSTFCEHSSDSSSGYPKGFGNRILRLASLIKSSNFLDRKFNCSVSSFDSISFENPTYRTNTISNIFTNLLRVFSRFISRANVQFIRERHFSGHVYSFQTFSSLYQTNNGLVNKNCRCILLPVTPTFRELGLDIDEIEDVYRPYVERAEKVIGAGGKRKLQQVGFHRGDYSDFFYTKSPDWQRKVVGPRRLELLETGRVDFKDLVDFSTGDLYTLDELSTYVTGRATWRDVQQFKYDFELYNVDDVRIKRAIDDCFD